MPTNNIAQVSIIARSYTVNATEEAQHRKEETTIMMGGSILITLLLLGLVVWALIKFFPDWQNRVDLNRREEDRREDSAEETLRQRFARGEIDAEEYEERHRILGEESPAARR